MILAAYFWTNNWSLRRSTILAAYSTPKHRQPHQTDKDREGDLPPRLKGTLYMSRHGCAVKFLFCVWAAYPSGSFTIVKVLNDGVVLWSLTFCLNTIISNWFFNCSKPLSDYYLRYTQTQTLPAMSCFKLSFEPEHETAWKVGLAHKIGTRTV